MSRTARAWPAIALLAGMADPRKIPGLVAWYDARFLDLPDNTPCGTWPDLSGNGNDLVQETTGRRPQFFVNSPLDNEPALYFDGVDDVLVKDPATLFGDELTLFARVRTLYSGVYSVPVSERNGAYIGINHYFNPSNQHQMWGGNGSAWKILTGPSYSANADYTIGLRHDGNDMILTVDGQHYTATIGSLVRGDVLAVGAHNYGGYPLKGYVKVVIAYDRAITDEQMEYLHNV